MSSKELNAGLRTPLHRSDWQTIRLKFLFDKKFRPINEGDGVVTAFRDGVVTLRSKRREDGFTFAEKEIGYQGVDVGDLVVHAMDGFAGAIGVSDSRGKCSPVCSIIAPKSDKQVEVRFWSYYLRNLAKTGFIESLAKGIRERSTDFRWNDISNLLVNYPDHSTQKAIADFLDQETVRIDQLIAKKQRLVALLEEKSNSEIRQFFQGLPEVTRKKLKFVASIFGGGTPSKDVLEYWEGGDIPWISPKDMKRDIITETEDYITAEAVKNSSTNYVAAGMPVLVVRSGILRNVIPIAITGCQATLNQDLKAFRFRKEVDPQYFVLWVRANNNMLLEAWRQVGATVESIDTYLMINSTMPIPPLEVQRALLFDAKIRIAPIASTKERALVSIDRLRELRSALITTAVTGQIDVTTYGKSGALEKQLDTLESEVLA